MWMVRLTPEEGLFYCNTYAQMCYGKLTVLLMGFRAESGTWATPLDSDQSQRVWSNPLCLNAARDQSSARQINANVQPTHNALFCLLFCLEGTAPVYLSEKFESSDGSDIVIRSQTNEELVVPKPKLELFRQSTADRGSRIWNGFKISEC